VQKVRKDEPGGTSPDDSNLRAVDLYAITHQAPSESASPQLV
jgi:hypothetical protein